MSCGFNKPCWHCGKFGTSCGTTYIGGKRLFKYCCYDYPKCKLLESPRSYKSCDICNRDDVRTYFVTYPDKLIRRFCYDCICGTSYLKNNQHIVITDSETGAIYSRSMFPHPNN